MRTALITGASSGIGLALAEVFAREGYSLVLVARGADKLEAARAEITQRYNVDVKIFALDLSTKDAVHTLAEAAPEIDVLANNVGIAEYGPFAEKELGQEMKMVHVNVTALTALTHLVLQKMISRHSGKILNIASTAAFQPGPGMAVYYATKAYVLSFSEGLREELRGTGISVTALCPGPTKTDFIGKQPEFEKTNLIARMGTMSANDVAEAGYRGLLAGKAIVIPGFKNKLLAWSTRFGPRSLVTKISAWTLKKTK